MKNQADQILCNDEYALVNHKKIETSRMKNKCASEQWLKDFCKRYNYELSLHKPQPTSLGRSSAFDKETVRIVYKNYKNVLGYESFY